MINHPLLNQPTEKLNPFSLKLKCIIFKNLANTYMSTNRYDDAIIYFQKALEFDQNDITIIYNLGLAARKANQYSLAKCAFSHALKINNKHWFSIENLAEIFYLVEDFDGCKSFINNFALKRDPHWPQGNLLLELIDRENFPNSQRKRLSNSEENELYNMSQALRNERNKRRKFEDKIYEIEPETIRIDSINSLRHKFILTMCDIAERLMNTDNDDKPMAMLRPISFIIESSEINSEENIESEDKMEVEVNDHEPANTINSETTKEGDEMHSVQYLEIQNEIPDDKSISNTESQHSDSDNTNENSNVRRSARINRENSLENASKSALAFERFLNSIQIKCNAFLEAASSSALKKMDSTTNISEFRQKIDKIPENFNIHQFITENNGNLIFEMIKKIIYETCKLYYNYVWYKDLIDAMVKAFRLIPEELHFSTQEEIVTVYITLAEAIYGLYLKDNKEYTIELCEEYLDKVRSYIPKASDSIVFYLRYLWLRANCAHKSGKEYEACGFYKVISDTLKTNEASNILISIPNCEFFITLQNAIQEYNHISYNRTFENAELYFSNSEWSDAIKCLIPLLDDPKFTKGKLKNDKDFGRRTSILLLLRESIDNCNEPTDIIIEFKLYYNLLKFHLSFNTELDSNHLNRIIDLLQKDECKNEENEFYIYELLSIVLSMLNKCRENKYPIGLLSQLIVIIYHIIIVLSLYDKRKVIQSFLMPSHKILSSQELCSHKDGIFLKTTISAIENEGINEPLDINYKHSIISEGIYTEDDDLSEDDLLSERVQCYSCLYGIEKNKLAPHPTSSKDIAMNVERIYSKDEVVKLYKFLNQYFSKILRTNTKDKNLENQIDKIAKALLSHVDEQNMKESINSVKAVISGEREDFIPIDNIREDMIEIYENAFYLQTISGKERKKDDIYPKLIMQLAFNTSHHECWFELTKYYREKCGIHFKNTFYLGNKENSNKDYDKRQINFNKYLKCYNFSRLHEKNFNRDEYFDYSITLYIGSKIIADREDIQQRLNYTNESYDCFYKLSYPQCDEWLFPFMCGKLLETRYKLQNTLLDFKNLENVAQHYLDASNLSKEKNIYTPQYKLQVLRLKMVKSFREASNSNIQLMILGFAEKYKYYDYDSPDSLDARYTMVINDILSSLKDIEDSDPKVKLLCEYSRSELEFLKGDIESSRNRIEEYFIKVKPKLTVTNIKLSNISPIIPIPRNTNKFKRKIFELYVDMLIACKEKKLLRHVAKYVKSGAFKNIDLFKKALEHSIRFQFNIDDDEHPIKKLKSAWRSYELAIDDLKNLAKELLIYIYRILISQNIISDDTSITDEWTKVSRFCKEHFKKIKQNKNQ